MKCPHCNKPMVEGRFLNNKAYGSVWLPKNIKRPFAFGYDNIKEDGGLCLADHFDFLLGYTLTAYVCKDCQVGFFPLTDQKSCSPFSSHK